MCRFSRIRLIAVTDRQLVGPTSISTSHRGRDKYYLLSLVDVYILYFFLQNNDPESMTYYYYTIGQKVITLSVVINLPVFYCVLCVPRSMGKT